MSESDENGEEEAVVCEVGLQRRNVGQLRAGDVLDLHGPLEHDVGQADDGPRDEAGHGGDVEEPVEGLAALGRDVEEAEQADGRGKTDSHVRDALLVGPLEDWWGLAFVCEGNEDTAAGVDVRVGGRENSCEKNGVDDIGKGRDTGQIGSNDQRRGGGVGGRGEEATVVGRDQKTNEEDGQREEREDAEERPADGRRDRLSGILDLTSTDTNKLSTLVGEGCLNQHSPETDKSSGGTGGHIFQEGRRVLVVVESEVGLLSNARVHADAENHETNDGDDLDAGKPHLEFTVDTDGQEVDSSEEDPENGNPDADVQIRQPVLYHETSRTQLQGKGNGPYSPRVRKLSHPNGVCLDHLEHTYS